MKSFVIALLFAVVGVAFAGDNKPAPKPSDLTELEQVKLENVKLRLELAQAQSQIGSAAGICEVNKVSDHARQMISDIEKAHGVDGYHFDFQSGTFVKNPDPPKPPEPPKAEPPKKTEPPK